MIYCVGLLVVALFTFLACKIGRIFNIFTPLGNLSFFKLHYLAYGLVLALLFPHNFMVIFEKTMGTVLMFCLSWIGLYYGCGIEIRAHQRYSLKTLLFHFTEPVIIFVFTVLAGILYTYIKFNEIRYFNVFFIIALFSSFTLYKRHGIPYCEENYAIHPVINDLLPARNILAITALSITGSLLFGTDEFVLFGHLFRGTFAFFTFHVIVGLAAGVILSMLIKGAHTTDSMSTVLIGVTALTGGISYTFSLSPLFIGMVSGAFLINSTLNRLQTIEALSVSNEHIEKIFMFFLGALLTLLIKSGTLNIGLILAGALGILIFRSLLKYILASLWVSRFQGYPKGTILLWVGLTGQGMIAAGAAVECRLHIPHMSSVFILLLILFILNQTVTGIYVLKNR